MPQNHPMERSGFPGEDSCGKVKLLLLYKVTKA